jgi:hypothetical protein
MPTLLEAFQRQKEGSNPSTEQLSREESSKLRAVHDRSGRNRSRKLRRDAAGGYVVETVPASNTRHERTGFISIKDLV